MLRGTFGDTMGLRACDMARLGDKAAIIMGGGQIAGEIMGNGRAVSLLFAREGARLLIADRSLEAAEETCRLVREEGGTAAPTAADVTREADCDGVARACIEAYGRIDILCNNVGIADGDTSITKLSLEAWHGIMDANLTGMFLACKHVLPHMRERRQGAVLNTSSMMSLCSDSHVSGVSCDPEAAGGLAYKVSKSGVNALTHSLAVENAPYSIRVNAILPGLMDTPNAIEPITQGRGISRDALRRERDAQVPLGGQMGTAWGRRPRGPLPRLRRGQVHHRRAAAGRRRPKPQDRLEIPHASTGSITSTRSWVSTRVPEGAATSSTVPSSSA